MLLLLLTSTPAAVGAPVTGGASHDIPVQGVGYGPRSMALQGFGRRGAILASALAYAGGGGPIVRRRKAPLPLLAARPRRDQDDDILLFIL